MPISEPTEDKGKEIEQSTPSQDVLPTKEEIPSTISNQEGAVYKEHGTNVSSVLVPQEVAEAVPIAEPQPATAPTTVPVPVPVPAPVPAPAPVPVPAPAPQSGSGSGSGSVTDSELTLESVPMAVQESVPVPVSTPEQKPEKEIVNDVDTSLAILEARCKRFGIPFDPDKHRPKAQTVQAPQRQQNNV